ncbi:MAG: COX15/CtaA family protein [Chitinophagaceae bacterium]
MLYKKDTDQKALAKFLFIGIGLLIDQILIGGITRLSGSGLSITEWEVITGILPPMSEQAWLVEFAKYKTTEQYQQINQLFSLSDFKVIYFWEWFHRLWARLIAVVFMIGVFYLWKKNYLNKRILRPLIILFILGGLQGIIGWIMVESGLVGDAVYVRPTKLALHFMMAMFLLGVTLWIGLKYKVNESEVIKRPKLAMGLNILIIILCLQLIFGCFMAGNKEILPAAAAASTWPDINGYFFPPNTFIPGVPFLRNIVENRMLIHFIHRTLGYLLFIGILIWTYYAFTVRGRYLYLRNRNKLLWIVSIQVLLGIGSVLFADNITPNVWGAFEWFALIHQLVAMILFLELVYLRFLVRRHKKHRFIS